MEGEAAVDSTLQKAQQLQTSLRDWKHRLVSSSFYCNRGSEEEAGNGFCSRTAASEGRTELERDAPVGGEVDGAWRQLTSYILELEKKARESEGKIAVASESDRSAVRTEHIPPAPSAALTQMDSQEQALLQVFSWLTTTELCRVSMVCRQWRAIALHPRLWERMDIRETLITPQALAGLGRFCSLTHSISLHGLMLEMAGPDEELNTYIARQRGSLEPGLAVLLSAVPNLTSLSITECNLMITERLLWLVSVHCPGLQHLIYCSDEFPPTPPSLWALSNGCPNLHSLHLPPYPTSPFFGSFNDLCLSTIATSWPRLLHLTVGGPGITADGLKELVSHCRWLEGLCVEYGPKLSSSDVKDIMVSGGGLTHLSSLSLSFTPISPKALYNLTTACPKLTSITLHISQQTYFPGSSADSAVLQKYHQIQSNFHELQQMPVLKGAFHYHNHPLTTTNTSL